jgi:hypothetical protein
LACYAEGQYADGWSQPLALYIYADGNLYSEGNVCSAEADLPRGATPRARPCYAEGERPSAYREIHVVMS